MTALEPRDEDDVLALQPVVRRYIAANVREVIEQLKPQVDGSYGPVNPRLLELYLKANGDLGKLYRVFDPPKKQDAEGPSDELRGALLRAQVQQQLEDIRAQIEGSAG